MELNGCVIDINVVILSREKVEFTNFYPELYQDVSGYLIYVHVAIAQLLHMIGVGESIDDVFHDPESITQLAGDGSDRSILNQRSGLIMV